ncbi:MFS transporter [Actinoplanes sp. NPDC051633]|uniref:MFS transporter n=1 Tax=Actinoplanes sp. NPDC051633 TaxID=3155670 RepID=UPI00342005FC
MTAHNSPPARSATLLLIGACMSTVSAVVVAPVLPELEKQFSDASSLVPLVVGVPAITMAVVSPIVGALLDRFGRRYFIYAGLVLFSAAGMAPLVLDSLPSIIGSRLLVGVATAIVTTTCTVLIGDSFTGQRRARFLALQTVANTVAAMVGLGVGGALGDISWRAPFAFFAIGVVLLPVMALIRPPARDEVIRAEADAWQVRSRSWLSLVPIVLLTAVAAVVVSLPVFETSTLLEESGVTSTGLIGAISALNGFATVVGAIVVREVVDAPAGRLLAVGFGLAALGYGIVASSTSLDGIVIGVVVIVGLMVANFGGGVLLPTLLIWGTRDLTYDRRGRGTGLWHTGFFGGQFATPILFDTLSDRSGSPFTTLGMTAVLCLAIAIGAGVAGPRRRDRWQPARPAPRYTDDRAW